MEMKVVAAQPSTPYTSAPSSPQRPLNLFFYSAPTSPRHNNHSFFFGDDHFSSSSSPSSVPFNWKLLPGVPKPSSHHHISSSSGDYQQKHTQNDNEESFQFDFSGQLDTMMRPSLSSADELFDGGKIKPLKPPPNHHNTSCPPIISRVKDALSLSPRHKRTKPQSDPFGATIHCQHVEEDRGRGRARVRTVTPAVSSNTNMKRGNSRKAISRSLSPLRVSEFALLQSNDQQDKSFSSRAGSKKWRLKDLFLFRSASEGRATGGNSKDPLRKYFAFTRRNFSDDDDPQNGSFRSTTSGGSVSKRRGGHGKISAHEMHYNSKRAVTEDLKKKTTLPYKHGLLGCLGFTPLLQDLSKAFASFSPS